jgi:hypothetical protein
LKSDNSDIHVNRPADERTRGTERISRALAVSSALLLLFVAYRAWGTGLVTSGAQSDMREAFLAGEIVNRSEPERGGTELSISIAAWVGAIVVSALLGNWVQHRFRSGWLGLVFTVAPLAIAFWNLFIAVEGLLPEGI